MNSLNLPKWDIQPFQEDEDGYVMLARPLTACTACPARGSAALVKNGTEESQVRDLPAQGKHVGDPGQTPALPLQGLSRLMFATAPGRG